MLGRIFNYETSRKFRSFLSRYGVSLRFSANTRPVDFTDQPGIDPIAAIYQAGGRPVLLKVPLKDCVFFSHLAFPCTPDSPSPQIQTLIEYGKGNIKSWEESPLVDFYNNFQPKNAAEMMGAGVALISYPVRSAIFPWSIVSPQQALYKKLNSEKSEARQHGFNSSKLGSKYFGPATFKLIEFEFYRLINIYEEITRNGFASDLEGFCNVNAVILVGNNGFKYFITQGDHRAAAMAALNKEYLNIQISSEGLSGLVFREDFNLWPAVRNNYLTAQESKSLFDRMYSGVHPSWENLF